MQQSYESESRRLNERARHTTPEELPELLRQEAAHMVRGGKPFAAYMRAKLRERGLSQQALFLRAEISENYGYKLIAEEKHTRQRDTILRLCVAAAFCVAETNEALILCGMAPLHARFARDAALIAAMGARRWDIPELNALLRSLSLPELP